MDISIEKFNKLNIILLCGLYGAGKTNFANMYFKGTERYRISRSEIRRLLFEMTNYGESWSSDVFNENDDILVKHIERKITEHYLHNMRNVLIINTFMAKNSRMRFINLAKDMKKTIGAIFLDTPFKKCSIQNLQGLVRVPEVVLNTLNMRKELPSIIEGFNEVQIIKDY